jgi:proline racemase
MRLSRMIHAIDLHAGGEPGRVVVGGVPDVPGGSMFEKMVHLREHGDGLRRMLLREPRGYPALCANVVLPATRRDADAGFVIMEQTEYPAMSGSNTICVATALIETGMVPAVEPVTELRLETPAGLVAVRADVAGGKVTRVAFENVPAFAVHLGAVLEVPELGRVEIDVAWGGMFYAIADAAALGLPLVPAEAGRLARAGEMIKAAAREQFPVVHPENEAIAGISIAQLAGRAANPGNHGRNAVVVGTGQLDWGRPETWRGVLDRSPCGTGTCARMAVLHARGQLGIGEEFRHEGVLDSVFTGRLLRETQVGGRAAVVPEIAGQAWITGIAQYVVDPSDPFPEGFTVGDLWGNAGR